VKRVACLVALVVSVAACTSSHTSATTPTTSSINSAATTNPTCRGCGLPRAATPIRHFSAGQAFGPLSFQYPAAWSPSYYRFDTSFADVIVYLSNAKLHAPCTTKNNLGDITTTCQDPIRVLPAGGVLTTWSIVGYPHPGPEIPHPNTTINGQPASIAVTKPGDCSHIGAQETVTAEIGRPIGNHFEVVACLRGPNVAGNEALVRQMLASTRSSD
jgi:hypothetical protein